MSSRAETSSALSFRVEDWDLDWGTIGVFWLAPGDEDGDLDVFGELSPFFGCGFSGKDSFGNWCSVQVWVFVRVPLRREDCEGVALFYEPWLIVRDVASDDFFGGFDVVDQGGQNPPEILPVASAEEGVFFAVPFLPFRDEEKFEFDVMRRRLGSFFWRR